jgi:protein phosphatase
VDHFTHRVQPGDIYLICSDGLTSMVKDEQKLAELIMGSATLREAGHTLIDAANAAGGRDNITVVLFRIVEVGRDQAAPADPDTDHTMVGDGAPTAQELQAAIGAAAVQSPPAAAGAARRVPRVPDAHASKPVKRRRGRKARRVVRGLIVSAVVALPILAGAWIASQSVYFVGTDDQGFVTLYRGMPYELPGGGSLYSVNYTSGVPVGSLTPKVKGTITAHKLRSRDDASDLIKQVEQGKLAGQGG